METIRTDRVFGITREVPLNYVARASADDAFVNNLTREKHVVLHGSSKQGKTSLRKECLSPADYLIVQCDSNWDIADLHGAILKEAGFEVTQSTTKTLSGKNKADVKLKAGFSLPFVADASVATTAAREEGNERTSEMHPLELDLYDVNDVIRALESIAFTKFLILEDFHYLQTDTQRRFAIALKAYHERSKLCFIIVGVWLEHDRLTVYNGDLVGRVVSINVDEWSTSDLTTVIEKGESLLNIRFEEKFVSEIVEGSLHSVYIVQEACHQACMSAGITSTFTGAHPELIAAPENAMEYIKRAVDQEAPRFTTFLNHFSDGFQDSELQMYKWILYAILTSTIADLEFGVRWNTIRKTLEAAHPKGEALNSGNLTIALQSVASLQVKKGITPIIIDYDRTTKRLTIVDRSFLIWLLYQDRNELLVDLDLPSIDAKDRHLLGEQISLTLPKLGTM